MKRRQALKHTFAAGLLPGMAWIQSCKSEEQLANGSPFVISTWEHGLAANEEAWKLISNGGKAIDAAEAGVRITESDPKVRTVGIGSYPDREGIVTLDACIMDGATGGCGAVAFLQDIENPISVARMVMDKTPHVMLVGEGARQFALSQGFQKINLLTDESAEDYRKWLEHSKYEPIINIENHDTIGLLALDSSGNLAGACTTSGAAYKMHGRVGDSPIIGAGLYVDNEVGGACATGLGEAVIRAAGSAMVVEAMRNGMTPLEACQMVVNRIIKKEKDLKNLQVGFVALRKDGTYGSYCIYNGFNYAVTNAAGSQLLDASFALKM